MIQQIEDVQQIVLKHNHILGGLIVLVMQHVQLTIINMIVI